MSDDFGLAKPFTHKHSAGGSKSPVCSKQSPWSISSGTAGIQLSHGNRFTLPNTALPRGKVSDVGLHPTGMLSPGSICHMARQMDGGWGRSTTKRNLCGAPRETQSSHKHVELALPGPGIMPFFFYEMDITFGSLRCPFAAQLESFMSMCQ